MALVARPHEEVGLRVQPRRQAAPGLGDLVDVLLSAEALALSDPPDLRRVLVDAGEKEGLVAALPMMPRENIGRDRRVRVPDVRFVVDVVDRRGHVEAHREAMIGTPFRRLAVRAAAARTNGSARRNPTGLTAGKERLAAEAGAAGVGRVARAAEGRGCNRLGRSGSWAAGRSCTAARCDDGSRRRTGNAAAERDPRRRAPTRSARRGDGSRARRRCRAPGRRPLRRARRHDLPGGAVPRAARRRERLRAEPSRPGRRPRSTRRGADRLPLRARVTRRPRRDAAGAGPGDRAGRGQRRRRRHGRASPSPRARAAGAGVEAGAGAGPGAGAGSDGGAATRAGSRSQRVQVPLLLRRQAHAEVDVRLRHLGIAARPDRADRAPSTTAASLPTVIEPRWVSVTEYPSGVSIVTLLPEDGTEPAKLDRSGGRARAPWSLPRRRHRCPGAVRRRTDAPDRTGRAAARNRLQASVHALAAGASKSAASTAGRSARRIDITSAVCFVV